MVIYSCRGCGTHPKLAVIGGMTYRMGIDVKLILTDIDGTILPYGQRQVSKACVEDVDGKIVVKSPKTYSSHRTITLPPSVIAAIDALPRPHKGRLIPYSPDALTERFRRAVYRSGRPYFRFHDLRHFGASMLASYGDRYVEAYGGWEAGSTAMKRSYQTLIDGEKERVQREMAQMFERRLGEYATRNATRKL